MEIKVGEYVRLTRNQGIRKIEEIDDDGYWLDNYIADEFGDSTIFLYKDEIDKNIVKHSNNIIDLIECGDYVNGHKVVNEIWGEDDNELYFEIEGGFNKAKYIGEKDIKSILTKEQFSSLEYII